MRFVERLEARGFFFPQRGPSPRPEGAQEVWFTGSSGRRLHGWFVPGGADGEARRGLVLHCHGNAGNIGTHWGFSQWLARRGAHLLLFDYVGYGQSDPGTISRETLQGDVLGALRFARDRADVNSDQLVLLGISLGVTAALSAAAEWREPLRAVACISGFRSWRAIASHHAGVLGRLCPSRLDAETQVGRLPPGTPLLIGHGELDEVIPVEHAHALQAAAVEARHDVTLHIEPGAHHNDWPDFHRMRLAVERFVARHIAGFE